MGGAEAEAVARVLAEDPSARRRPVTRILVGTAGWTIPRASAHRFTGAGTHLYRNARVLTCAEINSSFHRPHTAATYARWSASTPAGSRFAVTMPRTITHQGRLRRARPVKPL